MKEMLHLAEERHRDGTTIDYYFHKSTGHFYCVVHGFATGQNNSNRSSRLTNIQTIDDLVEYFKKRNVKWSDEAKEFFDELKEGNKMSKLTEEQRSKVKKFISRLAESAPVDPQFSNPFKNSRESILAIGDVLDGNITEDEFISRLYGARNIGNIDIKNFKLTLGQLAIDAQKAKFKLKSTTQHVIDKNATKTNGVFNESKIIKENNTYTMISALREIADDLLLNTELLIDNHYGKLDHEQFKNQWYKASNAFEAKFKTIIKNLMKAGK